MGRGESKRGGVRPGLRQGRPSVGPRPSALVSWEAAGLLGAAMALCYGLTAAGHGFVFDSGELSAAAAQLGIAHPPGQPLFSVVTHAFLWLPLGSLAFRAALSSALLLGVAVALLYRAFAVACARFKLLSSRTSAGFAATAVGIFALSPGVWNQGVRAEVYALHLVLSAAVIERTTCVVCRGELRSAERTRALFVAALCFGLGLSNHHLSMLCLAPAMIFAFRERLMTRLGHRLGGAALMVALSLAVYGYLPLRALTDPTPNLGAPTTVARLWWVVSAQAFQKSLSVAGESLQQRTFELVQVVVDSLGPVAVLALGGAYALLRVEGTRALGLLMLLYALPGLGIRLQMGAIARNPDAQGYLTVAFAAISFLGVALLARLGEMLVARLPRAHNLVLACAAGLVALQGAAGVRCSLARSVLADVLDAHARLPLPSKAVLIAFTPQTVFLHWGGEVLDRARPDLAMVPVPFVSYPGGQEGLRAQGPELEPVITRLAHGVLDEHAVLALARQRPVYVELDVRVPLSMMRHLVPDGRLYRVVSRLPDRQTLVVRADHQTELLARMHAHSRASRESAGAQELLLWQYYGDALYLAHHGLRDQALSRIALAASLFPLPSELVGLRRALARPEPVDIRAYRLAP